VAEHRRPLLLNGSVDDPRFLGVDASIDSSLSIPLAVGTTTLGVLNLARQPGPRFTTEDLLLATSLADLASVAVEKAYLYAALSDGEKRVSRLLGVVINAQEAERRRIADEMHDGFLQALTALFLQTEVAKVALRDHGGADPVAVVGSVQDAILRTSQELRDVVFRVCPSSVGELGLVPTLRAMLDDICASAALDGQFDNLVGQQRLPEPVEAILYRVAQEALRNVVKHAGASQVQVMLERVNGEVRLSVRDNGRGMPRGVSLDDRPGNSGFSAMQERLALAGGKVRVGPSPHGGTTVEASIPLASFS
jgi:signal transduction histidine kinase